MKRETMKVGRFRYRLMHTWDQGDQRWIGRDDLPTLYKTPRGKWCDECSPRETFSTPLEVLQRAYTKKKARLESNFARWMAEVESTNPEPKP